MMGFWLRATRPGMLDFLFLGFWRHSFSRARRNTLYFAMVTMRLREFIISCDALNDCVCMGDGKFKLLKILLDDG